MPVAVMALDLRGLREAQKLTRREVCAARGVNSETTVRNWENGQTVPTLGLDQALQLCRLYRCSLEALVEAMQSSQKKK